MSDETSHLPDSDEALDRAPEDVSDEGADRDLKGLKEVLSEASKERKNLQLLAEYFQTNISNLDAKKQFFENVLSNAPDFFQKLELLNSQMEDFAALEERTKDFKKIKPFDLRSMHMFLFQFLKVVLVHLVL